MLASAGPIFIDRDFLNAPQSNTWYVSSQANALSNSDIFPSANDLAVNVNNNIDADPVCLGGAGFYYGFDHDSGSQVDLLNVLLHELGHGLGFLSLVNDAGDFSFPDNTPDTFSRNMFDLTTDKNWADMSNAERQASSTNDPELVWTGEYSKAGSRAILKSDTVVNVLEPLDIAGSYSTGLAGFGPPLPPGGLVGEVVLVDDGVGVTSDGCEPAYLNANDLVGRIALIDRGSCFFTEKVKNAQDAGAIAVLIANNTSSPALITMSGSDPAISIPSV